MDLFPISDGERSVPAAPGARRYDVSLDGLNERMRSVLAGLSVESQAGLFAPLPAGADDDPDLGPALAVCGPRLLPLQGLAILPPELRFNSTRLGGNHRIFAAQRWINGVNGYAIAPSEFRPTLSVWSHSEGGLFHNGEYGPLAEWLAEQIEPLEGLLAEMVANGDAFEPDEIEKLTGQSAELWDLVRDDLPLPQPRPTWDHPGEGWTGESVAGRPHGRWTMTSDGVVVREEHYRNGLRHGPAVRWHLEDRIKEEFASFSHEQLMAIDDWCESVQGAVERVGTFVDGAAHGEFRFFDTKGRLLQEGRYEHGWPEGRWTVHPEAARGLADTASVEYRAGIPVSWTIPPFAFHAVSVKHGDAPATTLATLARDADGVIMVNCAQTSEYDLTDDDARELAGLANILVVGVHPTAPGHGHFGGRPIDVVADPAAGLTRAYGTHHESLSLLTYLDKQGRLLGGSERLARLSLAKWFERDREP
jgi:hypothetical protein